MNRSTILFLAAVVGCGIGIVLELTVEAWWAAMFLAAELIVIVAYPTWRWMRQRRARQMDADVQAFRTGAAANGAYDSSHEQAEGSVALPVLNRCCVCDSARADLPIDYTLTDAALELNALQQDYAVLEDAHLVVLRQLNDAHQRVQRALCERDEANARATAERLAP